MSISDLLIFILEIIGTIAFASSGALIGIRKNMDIFGICVLGITTAVGGGIIRDLVLGIHPPKTFQNPVYVLTSIATSCILFLIVYFNQKFLESQWMVRYEQMMLVLDTIGLAIFTVLGIEAARNADVEPSAFLLVFVGMVTGVGGGMMRDVMAGLTPYVFVKHIYACASMIGALICVFGPRISVFGHAMSDLTAMILGAVVIIVIRFLAAHYRWNLPRIRLKKPYEF